MGKPFYFHLTFLQTKIVSVKGDKQYGKNKNRTDARVGVDPEYDNRDVYFRLWSKTR